MPSRKGSKRLEILALSDSFCKTVILKAFGNYSNIVLDVVELCKIQYCVIGLLFISGLLRLLMHVCIYRYLYVTNTNIISLAKKILYTHICREREID